MKAKVVSGFGNGLGWGIGMGVALGVTTLASGGLRPVAKGAIKGGLWAREQLTALVAEARERAEDLYHEAQSERQSEEALLRGETVPIVVRERDSHPARN